MDFPSRSDIQIRYPPPISARLAIRNIRVVTIICIPHFLYWVLSKKYIDFRRRIQLFITYTEIRPPTFLVIFLYSYNSQEEK